VESRLVEKVLKSLSETQLYSILLLGLENFQTVGGKTWFQKELFLISNNIKSLKNDADFKSDLMGPYSDEANESLNVLVVYNIASVNDRSIKLTDFGKSIFDIIKNRFSGEQLEIVSDFKRLLNDMSYLELLGFIYFTYPEYIDESIVYEKVIPKRKEIAVSLLLKNKISISKAAEISGISIEEIFRILKNKGAAIYSE
jgi:hypothetical protein